MIIGKPAKYVTEEDALSHIAGYCVVNDLSERAFQLEGTGQWVKGKSADTFGPIGPWLVTRDEVADPQNLRLWLEVNGRCQNGSTATMVFGVTCGELHQPIHEPPDRRCYFDWNASWCGIGPQATGLLACQRLHSLGYRRAG